MEKKITIYATAVLYTVLILLVIVVDSVATKTYGQNNCTNSSVVFAETFGNGVGPASNPDVVGLIYQATDPLENEGTYRLDNDIQQKPEWHASEDGTPGDINGRMLVVNGQGGTFYSHRINRPTGFHDGDFTASLFLMNANTPGTCAPNPLLPVIAIRVEYLSQANTWVPFTGSPYVAPAVGQSIDPIWVGIGSTFNLPLTGTFLVKSIRIEIDDKTAGGCGNDFGLDIVNVSQCSAGGELPVQFLNINARQTGKGVSVAWSTSQEFNNKSFILEKSADGNTNWTAIATVAGSGNSSVVKNYQAYDPLPFKGINFYRVKQVDIDNKFLYSKTVSLKLNLNTIGVTVLANPFHNALTIDFASSTSQAISARLVDITGKQVAVEKWSVNSGSTRKEFSNVSALQQGIYILTVSNAAGEILYNNKVIKQ